MTSNIGVYSISDLLNHKFTPASEFGFDNIMATIEAQTAYVNAEVTAMLSQFCEQTTKPKAIWGKTSPSMFTEVNDDLGGASGKQTQPGIEMHVPLRKFVGKTGWTSEFLKRAMVSQVATAFLDIQSGYWKRMLAELQYAFYKVALYTYVDKWGDGTTLSYVRPFAIADSTAVPDAPDGTSFDSSTHTHYKGYSSSLTYDDIDAVITNVAEHGHTGLGLYVNNSNVATLAALASTKFVPITHAVLVPATSADATLSRDDPANQDRNNRLAGYWDGVPVFTRPWAISDIYACIATGGRVKPLKWRVDVAPGTQGLVRGEQYGMHPLTAQEYSAYYGFAPFERTAAAFLDGGHATNYTQPTSLIRS
jgi:hypothetical protein